MAMASLAALFLLASSSSTIHALDPLDPTGNITVTWDIMSWTTDGYKAMVRLINYQQYRHIQAPGWKLGWNWQGFEIIWEMMGAQATMQGDCSEFTGIIPHSCKRDPEIVDLTADALDGLKTANCCRSGVLSNAVQDVENSMANFELKIGLAGTSNTTVTPPWNFSLAGPGPGYHCSPPKRVQPSLFPTLDGRRHTQALMTWNITCKYSQALSQKAPTCCVSFSSFYNDTIIPCQRCACNCLNKDIVSSSKQRHAHSMLAEGPLCITSKGYSKDPIQNSSSSFPPDTPELYCTNDMCPVRVHWHIKVNYKEYWRAKVTITNRNLRRNFTQWNLVVQHPNFNNITTALSFNHRNLTYYGPTDDTAMFWGIRYYNEILMSAGPSGNVQSEILLGKNPDSFSLQQGWAFPHRLYFNGDECVLPPPDTYPWLPNAATNLSSRKHLLSILAIATVLALSFR